jgi:HlyD family secretion protein
MLTELQGYIARIRAFLRAHWILSTILGLVIVGGGWWYVRTHTPPTYQFVTVSRGPITETVSVTGSTAPIESVSLGFQNSGTVARVYHKIGDTAYEGEVIAQLNIASLSAVLQQAQAVYNSAVASRMSTSLPDAAAKARNAYLAAYTTLDTTLHDDIDTVYGGATVYGPELIINSPQYDFGALSRDRAALEIAMESYRLDLMKVQITDPVVLLSSSTATAQKVADLLNKLARTTNDPASQASATQVAALTTARASVDALLITLANARDTYRTASVGATSLADASVEQAVAGVALAKANLQGSTIVAPITGTITQLDAKVGQTASMGSPLVSIMSSNAFEVEAGIPETDVGKIKVGNNVTMTLDAFPNETLTGRIFYIDPAETITQGVVDYKIKVSFDTPDPRMKSGLTANLEIHTRSKDAVLILPQYAILQNDKGTFIKVLTDGVEAEVPVVLGMQDKAGNVEIQSGVTEGQQVLNIGLKQ